MLEIFYIVLRPDVTCMVDLVHGITGIPVSLIGMKFLGRCMPARLHHNGTPCCFLEAAVAESDESNKGKNKFHSVLYETDIARQNTGTVNGRGGGGG